MKKKSIVSLAVAGGLALAMVAPASAATFYNGQGTKFTALCQLPEIVVKVPTTGAIYLNPLDLPVHVGQDDEAGQILSTPSCIENQSEVPLKVSVEVTGAIGEGSDMILSSYSTKDMNLTSKRAFMYFEMHVANSDDTERFKWDTAFDAEKHIMVRTTTKRKKDMITLAAAKNGEVASKGGYGVFRIAGDAVKAPKSEWKSTDKVNVEIAFTFTPTGLV